MLIKHKESIKTVLKTICINTECSNFYKEVKSNFCSTCGQAPNTQPINIPYNKTPQSFLWNNEEFVDRLAYIDPISSNRKYSILFPNKKVPESLDPIEIDIDSTDEISLYDTEYPELAGHQMSWMLIEYAKELLALKEEGFEEPEVKWGLIMYSR